MRLIGIYNQDEAGTLAHIVTSISEASRWVGCSVDAFYKSLQATGSMQARGFTLELIEDDEDEEAGA